jgi:hydroxyacylglutathione hydrolase
MKKEFSYKDTGDGIYSITAPMQEQIYLILGSEQAMLVDTGMGAGSLKNYISHITDLPLIVVNTHGHPDHAGGNGEFDKVYLHPGDYNVYMEMCTEEFRKQDIIKQSGQNHEDFDLPLVPFIENIIPLEDGQVFDLGNRKLEITVVPGHTPGSICIYDSLSGSLFSGDTVTATPTWLFLEHSSPLFTYCKSLRKLLDKYTCISRLYPGHLPSPVASDLIVHKLKCARNICEGNAEGIPFKTFAGEGLLYQYKDAVIIYDPCKILNISYLI